MNASKTCTGCLELKDISLFGAKRVNKDGKDTRCKACRNNYIKRRMSEPLFRNKRKQATTFYTRRAKYGLSKQQYYTMFNSQYGLCKTCLKPETRERRSLCVDHCHKTGVIRGLLCDSCNRALGFVNDNIDTLVNMIEYLQCRKP